MGTNPDTDSPTIAYMNVQSGMELPATVAVPEKDMGNEGNVPDGGGVGVGVGMSGSIVGDGVGVGVEHLTASDCAPMVAVSERAT